MKGKQEGLRRTMRSDLVQIIQDEILGAKYSPGKRIKEDELSEILGISRTPIREALVVLEQQGLVEQKPHRGTFVATYESAEIVDMLRVQAVLEGLSAAMAAERRSDEQIQVLEQLTSNAINQLRKSFTPYEFYEYDRYFHAKLVECSGSTIITRILKMQFAQVYLCRYYTISAKNRFEHTLEEHQSIIESLRRSDEKAAERAAKKHIQSVIRDYLKSVEKGVENE